MTKVVKLHNFFFNSNESFPKHETIGNYHILYLPHFLLYLTNKFLLYNFLGHIPFWKSYKEEIGIH